MVTYAAPNTVVTPAGNPFVYALPVSAAFRKESLWDAIPNHPEDIRNKATADRFTPNIDTEQMHKKRTSCT
jgi:hypothetical protein